MTPFSEAARQIVRGLHETSPGVLAHGTRDLVWRHHGLGMLQAEFSEEIRIHIWDPSLVNVGMTWPRCVHDHRFNLTSAVVIGEIIDVPCFVASVTVKEFAGEKFELPPDAQWCLVYEIEHAKNQDRMVGRGCSTALSAKKLYHAYVKERLVERHGAGAEYHIERRVFHTTRVEALTATVVHRGEFDDRLARVLCGVGQDVTAVSGIVRDTSPEHTALVEGVIHKAAAAFRGLA